MKKISQSGFAVLEGLLILVIAGLIGFVGYRVYSTKSSTNKLYDSSASQEQTAKISSEITAPTINKASDLDRALAALNQINPNDSGGDSAKLNSQLSGF